MSILDSVNYNRTGSLNAFSDLAGMAQGRANTEKSLDAADDARRASAAGSALSTGLMVGMQFGGPAGWAAGLGMLAIGSLF